MRQRSSWYIAGSYCWAESAKGKIQSTASRIQKERLFTVGPRRKARINYCSAEWTGRSDKSRQKENPPCGKRRADSLLSQLPSYCLSAGFSIGFFPAAEAAAAFG